MRLANRSTSAAALVDETWGPFLDERVNPGASDRDQQARPVERELLVEAARMGMFTAALPREIGGGGLAVDQWALALERLGYRCDDQSFSLLVSLFAATAESVARSERPDLIDRYVRPLADGQCFLSFAWTEHADAFAFQSALRRDGDHVVVSAEKVMITGGQIADAFVTYVREGDDIDVVIIERGDPGVEVFPVPVMGVRAAGLARLVLHETRVPAWRVMRPGDGVSHVQRFLNARRILLSCGPVGRMRRVLELTMEYVIRTERYGRRIADFQNVQAQVGRMQVAYESARASLYRAIEALSDQRTHAFWSPRASVAKYTVCESALLVGELAMRITGGFGYAAHGRIERDVRDFHGLIAGAGAQDVLEVDIGMNAISAYERAKREKKR